MPHTLLVLAGGTSPSPDALRALPPAAMCIAADSGLDHARVLGLIPDLLIGDLDSVSAESLAWAEREGVPIHRYPADKDQTDLELALSHAVELEPARIVVAGIGGGRLDHFLANFMVLAQRRFAGPDIDGLIDGALISVVHRQRALSGRRGELISLLPAHGDAVGVSTTGLRWPLHDETLRAGTSRGVSNLFADEAASVSLEHGTLLAIQPEYQLDPGSSALDPSE